MTKDPLLSRFAADLIDSLGGERTERQKARRNFVIDKNSFQKC